MEQQNIQDQHATPSAKRTRDVLKYSFLENANKTPRLSEFGSPLHFIQILDSRLEKLSEKLTCKISESETRVLEKIDKLEHSMCEMKKDIINVTERVSKLETVAHDLIALKAEMNELKMQNLRQENSLVACDLRINGIPCVENENLREIFDSICYTLNINTPEVKTIFRLQNKNNKNKNNSQDAVIMAKLMSPYDKNFFLKSLSGFRKSNKSQLMLKHIGFKSNNPFYINEHLTPHNYKIFQSALNMKKDHHLQSVFTMRGLVYVKNSITDQPICVEHLERLDEFFLPQHNGASFQSNNGGQNSTTNN